MVTRAPGSWPQLTVGLCSADPSAGSTLPACSFPHKALGLFHQEEPFHRVLAPWTPSSGNHTPLASQPCGHPCTPSLSTLPEMEHLVGAADSRRGGSPDPLNSSRSYRHGRLRLCCPQGTVASSWAHPVNPEAPIHWEFPDGDRVTLQERKQRGVQNRQAPKAHSLHHVPLHGQHVPTAYAHHTLARHGFRSAWYSLLAKAGLCLETLNCSREHLGAEARFSPHPRCAASAKDVAWEPTS